MIEVSSRLNQTDTPTPQPPNQVQRPTTALIAATRTRLVPSTTGTGTGNSIGSFLRPASASSSSLPYRRRERSTALRMARDLIDVKGAWRRDIDVGSHTHTRIHTRDSTHPHALHNRPAQGQHHADQLVRHGLLPLPGRGRPAARLRPLPGGAAGLRGHGRRRRQVGEVVGSGGLMPLRVI